MATLEPPEVLDALAHSRVIDAPASVIPSSSWLYAAIIFLSAFLIFQVQLIISKYILPWFGGGPSVWNTCMLVFQVLLLCGYGYVDLVSRRLSVRTQARLHLTLITVAFVVMCVLGIQWRSPITPATGWKIAFSQNPVGEVIRVLLVAVGFPFFLLSTTGPLLQMWFSRTRNRSPYRLYALSNAGSLLGVISYPFLVERLRLQSQAWIWSFSYLLFLVMCGVSAWQLTRRESTRSETSGKLSATSIRPQRKTVLLWLALAACSSAMLLATTNLICQEIAVIPLLWVLPLCVYLLSFIICFDGDRWYRRSLFHPAYAIAFFSSLFVLSHGPANARTAILIQIGIFCLALLVVCMVCHGELVLSRPVHSRLSIFYLTIASGGALGSALVVLVAPRVFHQVWEFHLSLLLCGLLLLIAVSSDRGSWFYRGKYRAVMFGMIALLAFQGYRYGMSWIAQQEQKRALLRERNFFGVKTIQQGQEGIWLRHGQTTHGLQLSDPALRDEPTLYYRRLSGIGLILDRYPRAADLNGRLRPLRVGVVGMGAATLAAYSHPGDYYRFYEIDPQVVSFSIDPQVMGLAHRDPIFTFLQDSPATIDVALGDARLSLEHEASIGHLQRFDILALDAFSSDSIPVHLLTKEAIALYLQHLSGPDAVLAFHISNRALDLRPIVAGLSREYHLGAVEVYQPASSDWVLVSANPQILRLAGKYSRPVSLSTSVPLWTDDYSNLFEVLRK